MGAADRFDADAWLLVEAALRERGPLDIARLVQLVRLPIHLNGWRGEEGEPFDDHALWRELLALLCQAEAYVLIEARPRCGAADARTQRRGAQALAVGLRKPSGEAAGIPV
jgi:hypothetical protein